MAGCSSSLLDSKDSELDHLRGDGRFNKACVGLNLNDATLDIKTTRALVRCLNANGSIQEYQDLVEKMNDTQLGVVVDTLNAHLMTNSRRLKDIDVTYDQMDARGLLDRSFEKVSKVLAKGKFVRAAIRLLRQGSADSKTGGLDPAVLKSIRILAQELEDGLTGVPGLAAARANLDRGLGMGVAMASLKSYDGMVRGLRSSYPLLDPAGGTLEALTKKLRTYISAKIEAKDHPYGKMLLWGIADGTLLEGFDHYYEKQCDAVHPSQCKGPYLSTDDQIQAMEAFIRTLTVDTDDAGNSNREKILKPMIDLFKVMDAPISCMGETKEIPNADMLVMNEFLNMAPLDVPQWAMRTNILKIKLANGMCSFPTLDEGTSRKTFNMLLEVLRNLARHKSKTENGPEAFGRPLVTVAHFLKGLEVGDKVTMSEEARQDLAKYMHRPGAGLARFAGDARYPEDERYRRFMVHWLGDKSETNAYTHLAGALAELARIDRGVLGNLLYFLNVPARSDNGVKPPVARDDVRAATRQLMRLREDLRTATTDVPGSDPARWRSLYDVLSNSLRLIDESTVVDLALGMSEFVDGPDALVKPLLDVTRDALLMNNVNPVLEIALEVARDAENKSVLFTTLFDIADTKEFEEAMRLTAKMAGNGTLKELLQGLFRMFRGTTQSVPNIAVPGAVPPVRLVDAERDRGTDGRPVWNPAPARWPRDAARAEACYAVDLDLPFGRPHDGRKWRGTWLRKKADAWTDQLTKVAECANADLENQELEDFIKYGMGAKVADEKSFLGFLVDLVASIIPGPGEAGDVRAIYDELSDLMTDPGNFEDLKAMNRMLPFLFGKKYCSKYPKYDDELADRGRYSCPRDTEELAVVQALGRVAGLVRAKGVDIQEFMGVGRAAIEHPKLPRAGYWLYDLTNEADDVTTPIVPDRKPPLVSYPLNNYRPGGGNDLIRRRLDEMIRKYEKREPTEAIRAEKLRAYWGQPTAHEDKRYADYAGRERFGLKDAADLKKTIKPLLDELALGNRIEWSLAFFFYMDQNPYTPEWWASWFHRAANNVRPIPYYHPGRYPGDHEPTVRLVNQLDLLDLIVVEADFSLSEVGQPLGFLFSDPDENFSIKYLSMLAQSGRNITPVVDAMQKEVEFFASLRGGPLGLALKPEVKRRLFNLEQVFAIMREFDEELPWPMPDGRTAYLNDLGVLRDLFKATLSATPKKDWNTYYRHKNSLAVITGLVKSGLLRAVGTNLWMLNGERDLAKRQHKDDYDGGNRHVIPQKISHILSFLVESALVKEGGFRKLNKDTVSILDYLLRQDCNQSKTRYRGKSGCRVAQDEAARAKESFDERYVLIGKFIDEYFKWTRDDDRLEDQGKPKIVTYVKRSAYDALGLFDRLAFDGDGTRTDLVAKVTAALRPLVGTSKGAKLIIDNMDLIEPVLKDPKTIHLINLIRNGETSERDRDAFAAAREMLKPVVDQLASAKGRATESAVDLVVLVKDHPDFEAAKSVVKWMGKDPEYKDLKRNLLDRIFDQVRGWALREDTALRPRLQASLGSHLGNGDVRDLLVFMGNESAGHSDRFYRNTLFLGEERYVTKLNDFMDLLTRGLSDRYPPRDLPVAASR